MDNQKKLVFVVMIISVFVFVVALSSLYVQMEVSAGNACGCAIPIWLFIPLLSSIGLLIGTLAYYMLYKASTPAPVMIENGGKVDDNDDDIMDVSEIALKITKILPYEESKLVKLLIENDGKMAQAKLMKESGFDKVKVHRVLKRLEARKAVIKEKDRKINIIKLNPEIMDVLF